MFWFKPQMCHRKLEKQCVYVGRVIVEAGSRREAAREFEKIADGFNREESENYYYLSPTMYGGEFGYKTKKQAKNATIDEPKPDFD